MEDSVIMKSNYDDIYIRDAMDFIVGELLWSNHFPKQCHDRIREICEKVKKKEPMPFHDNSRKHSQR
jgi:hypothetical protein